MLQMTNIGIAGSFQTTQYNSDNIFTKFSLFEVQHFVFLFKEKHRSSTYMQRET